MYLPKTQDIADLCIECKECMDCIYLQTFNMNSPKDLANDMLYGRYYARPDIPYLCTMCGRCSAVCPEGCDPCGMIQEIRAGMVEESIPLPGDAEQVYADQKYPLSAEFALVKRAPSGNTEMMFFPGCGLAAYSPDVLAKLWDWIRENIPDCGLFLSCCGCPTASLGDVPAEKRVIRRIKATLDKLGCGKMVVACPDCGKRLSEAGIETVSIYELMVPLWNRETKEFTGQPVIHDPCKARSNTKMQEAVRELIRKSGHRYTEPDNTRKKTKCCGRGAGGLVEYTDSGWKNNYVEERCSELGGDFITYCANCRETLCEDGLEGIHILDLLFGDPGSAKACEPHTPEERTANQRRSRALLEAM